VTTHDSGGSVHALPPRASGDPWRPTVDDVAGLLRARTKDSEGLGSLAALGGVSRFPIRVKCASLAWHTLKSAILDTHETAKTE